MDAHAVFENDSFEYELGDDPFIRHKPSLTNPWQDRCGLFSVHAEER